MGTGKLDMRSFAVLTGDDSMYRLLMRKYGRPTEG
jgi:hypothetical protein